MERNRASFNVIFLLVMTLVLYLTCETFVALVDGMAVQHLNDDSMINFRVASIFAEYGVPYVNSNEPVAANSSLFWPIIISPFFDLLGSQAAVRLLYLLSIVVFVMTALVASFAIPGKGRLLCVTFILLIPTAYYYAGSAWEHVPQSLVVTAAFTIMLINTERRFWLDAAAFALVAIAFAIRPDVAPIIFVLGVFMLAHHRGRLGPLGFLFAASLMIPIIYFWLMDRYYGDWFPNTYYLKEPGLAKLDDGITYLMRPLFSGPAPTLIAVMLIAAGVRLLTRVEGWILAAISAQTLYIVYSGGDIFVAGRFFIVILPVICVLLFRVALRRVSRLAPVFAVALIVNIAWLPGFQVVRTDSLGPPSLRVDPDRGQIALERALPVIHRIAEKLDPADGSVGLHRLGLGYHLMDFHLVDFLGKAEPVIAKSTAHNRLTGHNKYDYAHAFDTYDIAVALIPEQAMAEADLPDPGVTSWRYFWVMAQEMRDRADYIYLSAEDMGLPDTEHGVFLRSDLVQKFLGLGSG